MSSLKTRFEQYILPGIIFQSVLIGGAYATGREIVEYGAKFGSLGIWSVAAIFAGFAIFVSLTYEFARLNRAYDYRTFVKSLIGRLWPIFDALFLVMVIVVIAVVSAASGGVEEVLGWPYWAGVMIVIALVGLLNFRGATPSNDSKSWGPSSFMPVTWFSVVSSSPRPGITWRALSRCATPRSWKERRSDRRCFRECFTSATVWQYCRAVFSCSIARPSDAKRSVRD